MGDVKHLGLFSWCPVMDNSHPLSRLGLWVSRSNVHGQVSLGRLRCPSQSTFCGRPSIQWRWALVGTKASSGSWLFLPRSK